MGGDFIYIAIAFELRLIRLCNTFRCCMRGARKRNVRRRRSRGDSLFSAPFGRLRGRAWINNPAQECAGYREGTGGDKSNPQRNMRATYRNVGMEKHQTNQLLTSDSLASAGSANDRLSQSGSPHPASPRGERRRIGIIRPAQEGAGNRNSPPDAFRGEATNCRIRPAFREQVSIHAPVRGATAISG